MRFCFKTLISSKNIDCIYKKLLSGDKSSLRNTYLIGSDISENNYYNILIKLIEHFKNNSQYEGAYVCLCKQGFYQYIPPDGYPTEKNNNEKCEHCLEKIGSESNWLYYRFYPIKREGYVRIFENKKDIENENEDKLKTINYITLEEFKQKKIFPLLSKEKPGIPRISKEFFKNENKQIRYITNQITYRLLNFILYSHLFFGGIINGIKLESFLPIDMNIIDVLEEDWNQLEIALNDKNIKIFINLIFKEITDELVNCPSIEKIEDLFKIEKKLDDIVIKSLEEYDNYKLIYDQFNERIRKRDLDSTLCLLNEDINYKLYTEDFYPFYKYFLYTDYIFEKNITAEDEYKMLNKFIDRNKKEFESEYNKKIKNLKTLDTFNKFYNLLYDTYSNEITRNQAEQKKLEEELINKEENKICDDFLKIINSLS